MAKVRSLILLALAVALVGQPARAEFRGVVASPPFEKAEGTSHRTSPRIANAFETSANADVDTYGAYSLRAKVLVRPTNSALIDQARARAVATFEQTVPLTESVSVADFNFRVHFDQAKFLLTGREPASSGRFEWNVTGEAECDCHISGSWWDLYWGDNMSGEDLLLGVTFRELNGNPLPSSLLVRLTFSLEVWNSQVASLREDTLEGVFEGSVNDIVAEY